MINMDNKIIIIDKPVGITSFEVIRILRKKLGIKKIGHAGTLDPLSSGVLVLGVGSGTKLLTNIIKADKTYEAEILLGKRTDTADLEGKVLEEVNIKTNQWSREYIENILKTFVGDIELPVPKYSAVKISGKKLYEKARKGEIFDPPKRIMKIYSIKFNYINYYDNKAYIGLTLDVGSGTYVRSIAEAIGEKLGVPSTLSKLRRTRVGSFTIQNAKKLEEF